MEVVIDIPEKTYKRIQALVRDDYFEHDICGASMRIIANGTPLPKGHGDLIDAGHLREDFKASRKISFAERMDISCIVDHAPIIIGADSEAENEDSN